MLTSRFLSHNWNPVFFPVMLYVLHYTHIVLLLLWSIYQIIWFSFGNVWRYIMKMKKKTSMISPDSNPFKICTSPGLATSHFERLVTSPIPPWEWEILACSMHARLLCYATVFAQTLVVTPTPWRVLLRLRTIPLHTYALSSLQTGGKEVFELRTGFL